MKITKEEFQRIGEESPLELFHQGIKAKETREKYTRTLRQVLCNIFEDLFEGDFEDRVNQFVKLAKEDPDWIRDLLINLSIKLKERTKLPKENSEYLNPSSVDNYFKPIKKLFDMSGVVISWNRVYATFPEQNNVSDSRGWSRDEIQKMLKFTNGSIDRAIILLSASSGIRAGGFDLNWQDLTPVYHVDDQLKFDITESEEENASVACAMIRIYQGTNEGYPAFITPEAYDALIDYKSDWTREVGRVPKPEDPIFKKEGTLLRRITTTGVKRRVERVIKRAGLRESIKGKRYEVPIMNGFRRFWNKTCKESLSRDSPLGSLIKKEFMMGHTGLIKLDRNYFKTHTLELAEEYLNAIPNLTISNEKRLRHENKKKTEKIEKLERQQREIDMLKFEVKRIDAKNKMTEAMKQRLIQWAEENPDKADALQMAKIDSNTIDIDGFLEHYLRENHGELEEFLDSISKTRVSVADK
ncbi:hypothetical protein BD31_I0011 [Candidatus Nitrosopumilus salaria BD31]|uniref:Integrase n=1 Tax=Candidatus Nitrosopumilus salarius BD31 TaxID=859350 RepID=I3D2L6_9ARCH|nr:integrase [Candidatus Nitrosopumilus salaria]EIJ65959.1 hypothetical protein BD31_I0011 [Candidatus Nitrosopumilus salaria BD31]